MEGNLEGMDVVWEWHTWFFLSGCSGSTIPTILRFFSATNFGIFRRLLRLYLIIELGMF